MKEFFVPVLAEVERVRSLTDFEGSDYLRYPLPHEERVKHLESWLREALVLPFAYEAVIDKDGNFLSFGQNLVEINQHAVDARKGQVGEGRAGAEMDGIIRVQELLNQAEVGDLLFLFSPPGPKNEGFGDKDQRRLTFTYIFEVGEGSGDDKKSVRVVAIPVPEISPDIQIKQFISIFTNTKGIALTTPEETRVDKILVSTPILVSGKDPEIKKRNLDKYSKTYAGKSWADLEVIIETGLKLEQDPQAEARRKSLIASISWQIRRYVDEKDGARLNNIGEAARVVMAREASGHYKDMSPKLLLQEYSKTESAMWLQLQYQLADRKEKNILFSKYGAQLVVAQLHLNSVKEAILMDSNTTGMLMGSACGGGGLGEALTGMSGRFGQIVEGRGHLLEKQLEALKNNSSETSSSSDMKCVTCPFCHEVVDAIVTSDKITCPNCNEHASRN